MSRHIPGFLMGPGLRGAACRSAKGTVGREGPTRRGAFSLFCFLQPSLSTSDILISDLSQNQLNAGRKLVNNQRLNLRLLLLGFCWDISILGRLPYLGILYLHIRAWLHFGTRMIYVSSYYFWNC
jgi:hypothetical protein